MTTFEPCGFRAKRTGAMTPNLDSAYEYGVEHFEVVYRIVPDLPT